jgi:hypothetical protein
MPDAENLDEVATMEVAVACLAVELPGDVWDDVRDKWHAVTGEIDRLRRQIGALDSLLRGESKSMTLAEYDAEFGTHA